MLSKAIVLLLLGALGVAQGASAPYPPSDIGIEFDWPTYKRAAAGSDNWPITWADDGEQYTSWGDGRGFQHRQNDPKNSLGFAKVIGDSPETYTGIDLWTGNGKSVGIISVEGILYAWVSPGSTTASFHESRVYRSSNHGVSWSQANWIFDFDDVLFKPTFLQFGQDYDGARDDYVYTYAPERTINSWVVQKPGKIALLRVHKNLIMTRSAYEFWDGSGWTSDLTQRQPVFVDAINGVMRTSVSYNPSLGRYLLITENTQRARGNIGIYDAPEPWGPWTTVLFHPRWGAGHFAAKSFFWNFSQKWADGLEFVLVFTGVDSLDAWNTIRGQFTLP